MAGRCMGAARYGTQLRSDTIRIDVAKGSRPGSNSKPVQQTSDKPDFAQSVPNDTSADVCRRDVSSTTQPLHNDYRRYT